MLWPDAFTEDVITEGRKRYNMRFVEKFFKSLLCPRSTRHGVTFGGLLQQQQK